LTYTYAVGLTTNFTLLKSLVSVDPKVGDNGNPSNIALMSDFLEISLVQVQAKMELHVVQQRFMLLTQLI